MHEGSCAWKILSLALGHSCARSPRSCGRALHGIRSLWWSWTGSLTLFTVSSFLSLPLLYSLSALFFCSVVSRSFLCLSTPPPPLFISSPPSNLWTREAELISCQAAASGYCTHCHRMKGFLGYWVCHHSSHWQRYSVLLYFSPHRAEQHTICFRLLVYLLYMVTFNLLTSIVSLQYVSVKMVYYLFVWLIGGLC